MIVEINGDYFEVDEEEYNKVVEASRYIHPSLFIVDWVKVSEWVEMNGKPIEGKEENA